MKMLTWAAVAVTALFALMNLGSLAESDIHAGFRIAAAVLGLGGILAAVGLGAGQSWGRAAVVAVGAANVVTSVIGLLADLEGAVIGVVVGGLGTVLGLLSQSRPREAVSR